MEDKIPPKEEQKWTHIIERSERQQTNQLIFPDMKTVNDFGVLAEEYQEILEDQDRQDLDPGPSQVFS